ncbi:HNH endonuclease [Clavibacter michiganensis subsp. michiganensis]|uniref:HNH endonuclease family protein n=1 Tax=Clavibacter michiganensis TaxID=28447 RepID=UPI00136525A8|nr:HNH endonuclease family protein [Clavibacter michiganensis]MWJ24969.1 HNH endonuclease [Clavibacter michiganensis subsp. michiganensis]
MGHGGRRSGRRRRASGQPVLVRLVRLVRGRRQAVRALLATAAVIIVLAAVVVGAREAAFGPDSGVGHLSADVPDGAVVRALAGAGLVRDGRIDVESARRMADAVQADGRGRHPRYDRDAFGPAWADTDGNGCDQRDDVLVRDLARVAFAPSDPGCTVVAGHLDDVYTGHGIDFARGPRTSAAVQIDHLVPLSWAWQHGAWSWSDERRERLATDFDELQAVDGPTNQDKSDQGPGTWLPPDAAYRCLYVTRFAFVVSRYGMSIDDADRDAIDRVLGARS